MGKIQEAERDLELATARSKGTEDAFQSLKTTMQGEMARFQRERGQQLVATAKELVRSHLSLAAELAKVWTGALEELEALEVEVETADTEADPSAPAPSTSNGAHE